MPSLTSARAGLTGVGSISVTDAAGTIRHSTQPLIVGESRRDEYAFKRLSTQTGDELVVSTPFLTPREPQQFLIPIGRRLTTETGVFEGIIVATFIPAAPREFFRTVDVGQAGAIWVFHPDGVVLFREPSTTDQLGDSADGNPIFAEARRGGVAGRLRAPLRAGGPALLSAFHSSSTPPLIVAVSLDQREVLTEWRHQARMSGLFFLAIACTIGGTLVILFRQMDDKRNAERALSEAHQRRIDQARGDQRASGRRPRGRAARTNRGGGSEHAQGRIPDDPVARAADAAHGDPGVGAHAGLGRPG